MKLNFGSKLVKYMEYDTCPLCNVAWDESYGCEECTKEKKFKELVEAAEKLAKMLFSSQEKGKIFQNEISMIQPKGD